MARNFLVPARQAILTAMQAEASITDIVPAERIYPPRTPSSPTWPFIRYGTSSDLPWKSSGEDGQAISTAIHCFARATDTNPDGEASVDAIKGAVAAFLDGPEGKGISLDLGGATAHVQVDGGRILQDEEADDWHAIVNIEIIVSAAA